MHVSHSGFGALIAVVIPQPGAPSMSKIAPSLAKNVPLSGALALPPTPTGTEQTTSALASQFPRTGGRSGAEVHAMAPANPAAAAPHKLASVSRRLRAIEPNHDASRVMVKVSGAPAPPKPSGAAAFGSQAVLLRRTLPERLWRIGTRELEPRRSVTFYKDTCFTHFASRSLLSRSFPSLAEVT
jgi:hypothetical protein